MPSDIHTGDRVLLRQPKGTRNCLRPVWSGPLVLLDRRSVNIRIKLEGSDITRMVHLNRCKKFRGFSFSEVPFEDFIHYDPDVPFEVELAE